MKNSFKFLAFLALASALVFNACKKDDEFINPGVNAPNIKLTPGTSTIFNLIDPANAQVDFSISKSGDYDLETVDIYKQLITADTTTPVIFHATISTLPANGIVVTAADALNGLGITPADLEVGDKVVLTFRPKAGGNEYISNQSLTINASCPSDLGGSYSVTTTYGYHDFLPNFATFTDTVEITALGNGNYSVVDFSGGLYSQGPYQGAYGTTGIAATFTDVCGQLSWININDPWGTVVQNATGPASEVDPATGIITINFFCNGYGENGVSIYTPL